jgi:hypothetical protein
MSEINQLEPDLKKLWKKNPSLVWLSFLYAIPEIDMVSAMSGDLGGQGLRITVSRWLAVSGKPNMDLFTGEVLAVQLNTHMRKQDQQTVRARIVEICHILRYR